LARKTKELAQETREKLLESAIDIMSEKPFQAVSMNEIAGKVGLSRGAAYWHFRNKTDLLVNVIRDAYEKIRSDFIDAENMPLDFEGLRGFFRNKLSMIRTSGRAQKINKLLRRHNEWPNEAHEVVEALMSEATSREREMIAGVISRAQERKEIRRDMTADELASILSAVFSGVLFFQLSEIYGTDFSKYADFIFDALAKELKCRDYIRGACAGSPSGARVRKNKNQSVEKVE
jgi:TetR/AcrR family acrAB operon transcriptional repressor